MLIYMFNSNFIRFHIINNNMIVQKEGIIHNVYKKLYIFVLNILFNSVLDCIQR